MERMFQTLEAVMNQTSIGQFRAFLARYPNETKWMLVSDYCLDDKTKPNRVVSFVLYPYILDFDQWNERIRWMQKTDLKHCRTVSPEFCTFAQSGCFFSFNFILDKHCILEKWNDPAALNRLLADCIELLERWANTTPQNAEAYRTAKAQFERVQRHTQQKNFNDAKGLTRCFGWRILSAAGWPIIGCRTTLFPGRNSKPCCGM